MGHHCRYIFRCRTESGERKRGIERKRESESSRRRWLARSSSSSWPQEDKSPSISPLFLRSWSPLLLSLYLLLDTPPIANNQVNARDFPRPDIDNSGPFIEAAQLSSSLAASTRPAKPLKVVIAGAGEFLGIKVVFRYFVSQWMGSECRDDPSDMELWEDLEGNWRGGNRRTG